MIVEFFEASQLLDPDYIGDAMRAAAIAAGATVLETKLHKFGEHGGVTGVVLLSESHISIHTWPECAYAAIDVFMCGNTEPLRSVEVLKEYFKPGRCDVQILQRGEIGTALGAT